ncbi:MAG TPA: anthranilate synthase component I family protein [Acidobacteriota bacterium]
MLQRMSREQFDQLRATGLRVPVYREVLADCETPVTAFLKLAADRGDAFLLESVTGGEHVGRHSFLGADPDWVLTVQGDQVLRRGRGGAIDREPLLQPALDLPRKMLAEYRAAPVAGLPPLIAAVGCFGYEAARWFEPVPVGRGPAASPELILGFYSEFAVFDHPRRRLILIAVSEDFDAAQDRLESMAERLARGHAPALQPLVDARAAAPALQSDLSPAEYRAGVRAIQEHILAGDAYQVVLSRRLSTEHHAPPFDVYRVLASINPSPYTFFLRFGELALAGSSPEPLIRLRGGEVEVRPIAGTRPRGADEAADLRLEAELLADPKEAAEHLMLVDLGRNDVGRCASFGSVRVAEFRQVERYSHVMHLVSSVRGRLAPGRDALDALFAAFPAGTVSGAPKVRAMQILAELEGSRRGLYAGAVGYLGADGSLDTCITIRTLVFTPQGVELRVGAGVVADSEPQRELEETEAKAAALIQALAAAGRR